MRGGELGGALLKVELELLLGERLLALGLELCGPLQSLLISPSGAQAPMPHHSRSLLL